MEHVLENFIVALRNAGVRVSISESIDAARALDIMGYRNRKALKISLGATLAKTPHEKEIFGTCFDTFFSFDSPSTISRVTTWITPSTPGKRFNRTCLLLR